MNEMFQGCTINLKMHLKKMEIYQNNQNMHYINIIINKMYFSHNDLPNNNNLFWQHVLGGIWWYISGF